MADMISTMTVLNNTDQMAEAEKLKPTLDVLDAAAYLNLSKYTVINRIKEGKLKAYKEGIRWRIKRNWLLEYQENISSGGFKRNP
ncbi:MULTISPECIES: helix-turn-helix domain-containing protein [Paenibacillus]|uniref:helix-turn-helix domain-containing protein n=1 Tax=Paenibacillus TaxID=44249 RepID=UPI00119F1322|nr:helix-turn-helix domain-containing protein [Paenibacillus sp. IHBB 10380]